MKKLKMIIILLIIMGLQSTIECFAPKYVEQPDQVLARWEQKQKEEKYLSLYNESLNKLKEFEGLSLVAYYDHKGYTIGYGHFVERGEKIPPVISIQLAETLLKIDFEEAIQIVERNTGLDRVQNPEKVLALAHFVFNFGGDQFERSTLLKCIKADKPIDREIVRWNKASVVNPITAEVEKVELKHLTMRRHYELDLYNS